MCKKEKVSHGKSREISKEGVLRLPLFFYKNINNIVKFKSAFLKEFNIPYSGEQEFDILKALITDLNKYIQNTYKIEDNILYSEEEKREILQKRYEHTNRVWVNLIKPKLEKMKEMDPENFKFLPKILTIPSPK